MPEKARIFLAEDNPDQRKIQKFWLEEAGHTVVIEASTLDEALEKVKSAKELEVNVGVLDGSLREKSPTDGPRIAEALRKAIPGIKIVSFSGAPVGWGDENPAKPLDIAKLGEIVTRLKIEKG